MVLLAGVVNSFEQTNISSTRHTEMITCSYRISHTPRHKAVFSITGDLWVINSPSMNSLHKARMMPSFASFAVVIVNKLLKKTWILPSDKLGHIENIGLFGVVGYSTLKTFLNIWYHYLLNHWGRTTHICVGNLTIIGSDNGLLPDQHQAIIWTNAGILLIGTFETNFSEISIVILTFSFKKRRLKVSSAKRWPFCLGINVLTFELSHPENQATFTEFMSNISINSFRPSDAY